MMSPQVINAPQITLDGKRYQANKPRVGLWRKIIRFNNQISELNIATDEEAYNELLNLLVEGFNNPEVTVEAIEAGLDLDQLMPTFQAISSWIGSQVGGKGAELPNGPGPAGN